MPPSPSSPPVTAVQRKAMAYIIAASASVSSEKYTPLRLRISAPNSAETTATSTTAPSTGKTKWPGKSSFWISPAA